MVTDSIPAVTQSQERQFFEITRAKPCAYCKDDIHWMLTRYGTRMPFDAALLPAEYLAHGVGWIPGLWPLNGREKLVMAPHEHYGLAKRARVTHVATLHQCRGHLAARKARAARRVA